MVKLEQPLRISFCTTCMGRLYNLKETLPHNLKILHDYPNAELVILNYNSKDGLGEWIRSNYSTEIASGRILYAHYRDADHFNMPHAKNMAHRIATGDVLCNLDADNKLAEGMAEWLNEQFSHDPNIIIYPDYKEVGREVDRRGEPLRGIMGRVAIKQDNFYALRGYNEAYQEGWEDRNFTARADKTGRQIIELPPSLYGHIVPHTDDVRVKLMRLENSAAILATMGASREERMKRFMKESFPKSLIVNTDGSVGVGTVTINFADNPITIDPLEKIRHIGAEGDRSR